MATPLEESIFEETNKVRENPQSYIPILEALKARNIPGTNNFEQEGTDVQRSTKEGVKAIDEAIEYLKNQKPVPVLERSPGVTKAARDHAADQKNSDAPGHTSSNGDDIGKRLDRYGEWLGKIGENISFKLGHTNNSGQDVVVALIVDDGVPKRGHRGNIFQPEFKITGVACGEQKIWDNICVMDYVSEYTEKTGTP